MCLFHSASGHKDSRTRSRAHFPQSAPFGTHAGSLGTNLRSHSLQDDRADTIPSVSMSMAPPTGLSHTCIRAVGRRCGAPTVSTHPVGLSLSQEAGKLGASEYSRAFRGWAERGSQGDCSRLGA